MNSTTNFISLIDKILKQRSNEADRRLAEAVIKIKLRLRDRNALSGGNSVAVDLRPEYEKDIESRRDTFLSIIKKNLPDLNLEQRQELLPELIALSKRWLGQHINSLEQELNKYGYGARGSNVYNLG